MELYVFGRFHAHANKHEAVAAAMRDMLPDVRAEAGCLAINVFRSVGDPRLFYIHSCWKDEAAFDAHATLPHTLAFLARVRPLIDHYLDVTRALPVD